MTNTSTGPANRPTKAQLGQFGAKAGLVLVLLIPALTYGLLAIIAPPQYRFVLEDASLRGWPIFYASLPLLVFAALTYWALLAHGRLTLLTAVAVAFAPVAALGTALIQDGFSTGLLGALLLMIAGLVGAFVLLRRVDLSAGPRWTGSSWTVLIIAALLFVIAAIASGFDPINLPRSVGSLAILALFVGLVGVILCIAALRPRFAASALVYVVIAGLFFGTNDHRVPAMKATTMPLPLDGALGNWLAKRQDIDAYRSRRLPYPVILVSSEGGGIYAAAHAYGALGRLANHCPTFTQHVFAMVGVSGGAFGNALFAGAMDPAQRPYAPCGPGAKGISPGPVVLDHLSPVLARLLLIEPIDRLLPGRWAKGDRAQILTESFLADATGREFVRRPIGDTFDPAGARPAVLSVAVDIASGRRLVASPIYPSQFGGTAIWWPLSEDMETTGGVQQISLLNAAGLSARFPWITPTGRLPTASGGELILADGGFFDNSGADTVLDLVNDLRSTEAWRAAPLSDDEKENARAAEQCGTNGYRMVTNFHKRTDWADCIPIFIVHLALASSNSRSETRTHPSQSFLFDPIKALMATRESRAEIALRRADVDLCGTAIPGAECYAQPGSSMGFFRNDIAPRDWNLPLGWFMSKKQFSMMVDQAVPEILFDYRRTKKEASSDVELLIYHLDPALYDESASPTLGDLMPDP